MATTAPVIGTDWTPLASAGDNFFLTIPPSATHGLWVAVSDTETEPTVDGHFLDADKTRRGWLNRDLVGPGYVYARVAGNHAMTVALSAWTPAA